MIVNNIVINDFKNFQGSNKIDLRVEKDKNIILFGGMNGTGKTTLAFAARLCLYGKYLNGRPPMSIDAYSKLLSKLINKTSKKKGVNNFSISMEIHFVDVYPMFNLTIIREWVINKENKAIEQFTLLNDGKEMELIPRESWQEYIFSLFSPDASQYYFFDGERIRNIVSNPVSNIHFRESVRDLIGIKLLDTTNSDLLEIRRRIVRKNLGDNGLLNKINEFDRQKSDLENEIEELIKRKEQVLVQYAQYESEKAEIEEEINRIGGGRGLEFIDLDKKIDDQKAKVESIKELLNEYCGNQLPFQIAKIFVLSSINKLKNNREQRYQSISNTYLKNNVERLARLIYYNIETTGLLKDNSDIIGPISDSILALIDETKGQSHSNLISEGDMDSVIELLENILQDSCSIIECVNNLEHEKIHLQKMIDKQRLAPIDSSFTSKVKEIGKLEEKLNSNNIYLIDSEIQNNIDLKEAINYKIDKLEKNVVAEELEKAKIDLIDSVIDLSKMMIEDIINNRLYALEQDINYMFDRLAIKNDLVNRIIIDNTSFIIRLIDMNNDPIDPLELSEGEKEILALSLIYGLSKINGNMLPIFFDSPLGKMDSKHVNNIIKYFYDDVSKQVILLSHDREITPSIYHIMRNRISKSYLITYSDINKIKEGYFRAA